MTKDESAETLSWLNTAWGIEKIFLSEGQAVEHHDAGAPGSLLLCIEGMTMNQVKER